MSHLQTQISTALQDAMREATDRTPSGFHRAVVIGQVIVNVKADEGGCKGTDGRCCCGGHK